MIDICNTLFHTVLSNNSVNLHPSTVQVERQSKALDKKSAKMEAEAREEAKEGLRRDALESREALGLVPCGIDGQTGEDGVEGEEEGVEEEVVPPQVLKERIESVVEVLSSLQVSYCYSRLLHRQLEIYSTVFFFSGLECG